MTDKDLDKWIQEHIMGYGGLKTVYRWADRGKKKYPLQVFSSSPKKYDLGDYSPYVDEKGTKIYCARPHGIFKVVRYTESISDAFQVVEKLNEKGIIISFMDQLGYEADDNGETVKDKIWRIQFMNTIAHEETDDRDKIWFPLIENDSLPLCLCLAAKKAYEELP